jgi:hypothetical protein
LAIVGNLRHKLAAHCQIKNERTQLLNPIETEFLRLPTASNRLGLDYTGPNVDVVREDIGNCWHAS